MNQSMQATNVQFIQQQSSPVQSGLAIASLVLGILSILGGAITVILPVLALIFGIQAISKCKKNPQITGKGMAIAGLIMGGLSFLLVLIPMLCAIIIPTVGKVRETSVRSVASSNLRQIGQASLIYATDNNDWLPTDPIIIKGAKKNGMEGVMLALADGGGLNDASVWFAGSDADKATGVSMVMNSDKTKLQSPELLKHSYCYVVGLIATDASTTPIAWTRGLQKDGTWSKDSPWGGKGGHIVFIGGNVTWVENTKDYHMLISRTGEPCSNYEDAIPDRKGVKVIEP